MACIGPVSIAFFLLLTLINPLSTYCVPRLCKVPHALLIYIFRFYGCFIHIAIVLQTVFAYLREGFCPAPFSEPCPGSTIKYLL